MHSNTPSLSLPSSRSRKRAWAVALLVCLLTILRTSGALADDFVCPSDDERTCDKLERRFELRREKQRRADELHAHRLSHPWKIRLAAAPTAAFFGLDTSGSTPDYSAEMWGLSVGASVLREYRHVALLVEGLTRVGAGSIHSWSARGGYPHRGTGAIVGGELHTELRFRQNWVFVGPAASIGLLHFNNDADLYERDEDGGAAIRVPENALFAVVGGTVGKELGRPGSAEIGARVLAGVWNQFDRGYVQVSFVVAGRLWE